MATAGAVSLAGCTGGGGGGGTGDSPTPTSTPTSTPTPTDTSTGTATQTSTGTATPGEAALRVVHASPNAPPVDVYVDDSVVLEDVPFGAVSDYLSLTAGTYGVEVTAAGDPETVVFSGDVGVEADTDYTVVATGEIGEMADEPFAPLVLTDDNSDPGAETARVRLVHASPDAPAVDVTVGEGGDVLFDGVAFGETGTVEVPAGDYTVDVRGDTETNDGDVVASFDLSLAGGTVYTAFAVGYLSPDDEPADTAFDLVVAEDAGGD